MRATIRERQLNSKKRLLCRFFSFICSRNEALVAQLQRLQKAGLAASTRRTYASGEAAYLKFCQEHSLTPLPATPSVLAYFVSHLSISYSVASIDTYLVAVRAYHIRLGHPFLPDPAPQLELVLRGVKRLKGLHARPQRLPITGPVMRQIKQALASLPLSHFDQHLFWAAFTLAYFGFLRFGELVPDSGSQASVSLSHSDVQIGTTEVTLRIPSSKTDPFRRGASVRLAATGTSLCPVRAVSDYQAYRPASSPNSAFLLQASGTPLTRSQFVDTLRRCLNVASVPFFRPAILSSQLPYRGRHHCSDERGPRVAHPGLRPLVQRLLPAVHRAQPSQLDQVTRALAAD